MSSRRPPSGLHKSRHKYWGTVYGAGDSRNDNKNDKDCGVDDDNVPVADNNDEDNDDDNNNTDVPIPYSAAAALSPLTTVADVGSIINPYVGSSVL
jgi:hypothetical protein